MTIAALILAGGESKRFNSKIPKQFHKIQNELMINHSIKKLLGVKKISQIILVINRSKFRKYEEFIIKNKKIKREKMAITTPGIAARDIKYNKNFILVLDPIFRDFFLSLYK